MRTRSCDPAIRHGRLRKAGKFLEAVNLVRDFADEVKRAGRAAEALVELARRAAAG